VESLEVQGKTLIHSLRCTASLLCFGKREFSSLKKGNTPECHIWFILIQNTSCTSCEITGLNSSLKSHLKGQAMMERLIKQKLTGGGRPHHLSLCGGLWMLRRTSKQNPFPRTAWA